MLACVGLLGLSACANGPGQPSQVACERLGEVLHKLHPNSDLTLLKRHRADGPALPEYCQVQGRLNPRQGQDGRAYAIGFELRLPFEWNGRFLHQANGGTDGVLKPALGELAVHEKTALSQGFVVLSSDGGHRADDPANADDGLARGVVFGQDPQARRDFAHTAIDALWPLAQGLITQHYGQKPRHNYLAGCGNGGRLAMVAASRYPERYDGILAGAPALHWPRAALQHAWDAQAWQRVSADSRQALSPSDMRLIADKVVARCDALDMVVDGMVGDLRRCQQAFRLVDLQCTGAKTASCLSAAQVQALGQVFIGPHSSRGEALYTDWLFDAGLATASWRAWRLESNIEGWGRYPVAATIGAASLANLFSTPPLPVAGSVPELQAFLSDYNFDAGADHMRHPSALRYSPPDVDAPTLAAFAGRGGRMIVYHGASDPAFSIQATLTWAEKLQSHWGLAKAQTLARVFAVPGMGHCRGGPATDRFDALGALVAWVEQGHAPEQLLASATPGNPDWPKAWPTQRTRPLCPWPRTARYAGGDVDLAASFRCVMP